MKYICLKIFMIISFVANSDTYMCHFPCTTDSNKTCSHYYTRIDKNSFYEDKKQKIFESKENEDHLLLTRIGFPTEGDLPEYVFVEHVYIDKFNDLKFKKYGFDNFEVDKLKTGKCKFKVFQDPLSTE